MHSCNFILSVQSPPVTSVQVPGAGGAAPGPGPEPRAAPTVTHQRAVNESIAGAFGAPVLIFDVRGPTVPGQPGADIFDEELSTRLFPYGFNKVVVDKLFISSILNLDWLPFIVGGSNISVLHTINYFERENLPFAVPLSLFCTSPDRNCE